MARRSETGKRIVHYIEFHAILVIGTILRFLPRHFVYWFARVLGVLAFDVFRIRRGVTLDNLTIAFGDELSEEARVRLARDAYRNIAMTFIELALIPAMIDHIGEMVDVSELKLFDTLLTPDRGMILISGHFGSWELNGGSIVNAGYHVTVVVKRQANLLVDDLIKEYRALMGMTTVHRGASVKHLVKALRSGGIVGLISDQNEGKHGIFVNFFGKPASTPAGAAQLALKYDSPVVAVMTKRLSPGKYKSIVRQVPVLSGDTVESLTERFTLILEQIIRENPEQYFWMHKRWKTRPETE